MLEKTVNGPGGVPERLEGLRSDLDSFHGEFLVFRDETRAEFSAIRGELSGMRGEMSGMYDRLHGEVTALRTHMLVPHEEAISRLALLVEGRSGRP